SRAVSISSLVAYNHSATPLPNTTSFFFSCYGHHRDLHSFPTRRSSDLEFHNEGSYIDPATKEKLFTPFFTTKKKGTGLGLAISRSEERRVGKECRAWMAQEQ